MYIWEIADSLPVVCIYIGISFQSVIGCVVLTSTVIYTISATDSDTYECIIYVLTILPILYACSWIVAAIKNYIELVSIISSASWVVLLWIQLFIVMYRCCRRNYCPEFIRPKHVCNHNYYRDIETDLSTESGLHPSYVNYESDVETNDTYVNYIYNKWEDPAWLGNNVAPVHYAPT